MNSLTEGVSNAQVTVKFSGSAFDPSMVLFAERLLSRRRIHDRLDKDLIRARGLGQAQRFRNVLNHAEERRPQPVR